MGNVAKEIIKPTKSGVFRVVFLYVGQGDATLLVVPDGESYKYLLVDSNTDEEAGGIDILKLLKDLFAGSSTGLDIYINTHPHNDHLKAVKDIYEKIGIDQIWHSGHTPGKDKENVVYKDFKEVMDELGNDKVFLLKGSREENKLDDQVVQVGDIKYNILAPAEYVSDDIEDEKADKRYSRIHEQCSVIRFRYGKKEKQVLITGDADYVAWSEHIADYHKDRLPSTILSAAHHGSNSFFWKASDTEEDAYEEHLDKINPTYIVVSAPKQKESRHDHPDDEAMEKYRDKVGKDAVFHLGAKRECVIVDIDLEGNLSLILDDKLVEKYGFKNGGDGGKKESIFFPPPPITKLDDKPMGK